MVRRPPPRPPEPPADAFRAYPRPDEGGSGWPFRVRYRMLHDLVRRGGHWVRRHRHQHYELLMPYFGAYRCRLDGEPALVRPGQAVLIRPGGFHEDCCDGPIAFHALTFETWPGPADGQSADILAAPTDVRVQVFADRGGRLRALCQRIAEEAPRGDALATQLLDAFATEALAEVLRALPAAALTPDLRAGRERAGFARRIDAVFARHTATPVSVPALAAEMGMPERTLTARCRRELGASPARLLLRYRLRCARDLLRHTGLTIAEVAESLGFASPFHCSRAYKRCFGRSPSADRGPMPE